jgi:flagellin-like hook-associated protein FlgL
MTIAGRRTRTLASLTAIAFAGLGAGQAFAAPPPNDNFASATVFTPTPGTMVGANAEATRQTGEPQNGNSTVWWRWTAPESGRYRVDTCETVPSFDSFVGVYQGTAVNALTAVATNDDGCASGSLSVVNFDAVAGQVYRFSVGSSFSTTSQNIRLSLRRTPLNDNFEAAADFGAVPGVAQANNTEATRQTGEPQNGNATLWWSFTAPETGRYRADTCETVPSFDSLLGVYTGSAVNQLVEVARNDDGCPSGSLSVVNFDAVAGSTYFISVGSSFSTTSQNIRLAVRRTPVNDNFAQALAFGSDPGVVLGTNVEATRESGEPDNGSATVWWFWTASKTESYRLDTCGTTPAVDTYLGVYTGSSVSQLSAVPYEDVTCRSDSSLDALTFKAQKDTTYYFSVGGYSSSTTSANLRLALASVPCVKANGALTKAQRKVEKKAEKVRKAKAKLRKAKAGGSAKKIERAKDKLKSAKDKLKKAKDQLADAEAAVAKAC